MRQPLKILVDTVALLTILSLVPFAWILRDGLGPDSTTSSGMEALGRCFMTFYAGPISLALLGLALAVRYLGRGQAVTVGGESGGG